MKKFSLSLVAILIYISAPFATAQEQTLFRATSVQNGVETTRIVFNLGQPKVLSSNSGGQSMNEIAIPGIPMLSHPGVPKLPFYSFVVAARPEQISITMNPGPGLEVQVGRLAPCPPEKMRCAGPALPMVDRVEAYARTQTAYRLDRLGDFRGQPLYRVTLLPHHYDYAAGKLTLYTKAEYTVQLKGHSTANYRAVLRAPLRRPYQEGAYDYLVLTPPQFKEALAPWIEFKTRTQNLRFKVMEIGSQRDPNSLKSAIASEYSANKFVYALIVGSQKLVPNFSLPTSTTSQTPTDLPYFTMGGQDDYIPDVLAGRLVATTVDDVKHQLKKWMDYEQGYGRVAGWGHGVGVASNQGASPSDEDYVRSMEKAMIEKAGTKFLHFAQNDSAHSNPTSFNAALNAGAMWAVYVGHGSGTSWPSFGVPYTMQNIKALNNANEVKPVWIDVACQNGGLLPMHAGERLSNEVDSGGNPIGTTAYYGGTVNVSWDPPAILARGITYRMVDEPAPILGAVIQMGHAYLAEQISDVKEIRSNQIWYHLQGDPALRLHLKAR